MGAQESFCGIVEQFAIAAQTDADALRIGYGYAVSQGLAYIAVSRSTDANGSSVIGFKLEGR